MRKRYIAYAAVASLAAAVVIVAVSSFIGSNKKHSHPTPPVQTTNTVTHGGQPTPTQAGAIYAASFNHTPPVTIQIIATGRCVVSPNDVTIYACAFRLKNTSGQTACYVVPFKLDAAARQIGSVPGSQPQQLASTNPNCPA